MSTSPAVNFRPREDRKCLGCGIEFRPNSSRHIRCSPCGQAHEQSYRRAWFKEYRQKNNEFFLEYARRRRRERGSPPAELREKNNRRMRRDAVMRMLGYKCMVCGYDRCRRSLHVHHIDPSRKQGDKDFERKSFSDFGNLALLCANCHFEVHDGLITLETRKEK